MEKKVFAFAFCLVITLIVLTAGFTTRTTNITPETEMSDTSHTYMIYNINPHVFDEDFNLTTYSDQDLLTSALLDEKIYGMKKIMFIGPLPETKIISRDAIMRHVDETKLVDVSVEQFTDGSYIVERVYEQLPDGAGIQFDRISKMLISYEDAQKILKTINTQYRQITIS